MKKSKSTTASTKTPSPTIRKKPGDVKKASKKDDAFLEEAGPVLGPALLKLLRDPSKPPFHLAFREDGEWKVPTDPVANYGRCEPDADEATLKAAFHIHDLYALQFHGGEWKLKIRSQLKRFLPLRSYGDTCSRHHLIAGLSGNFTTYAIDDGFETDYESEELIVLHEQADLVACDWSEKRSFGKCYY